MTTDGTKTVTLTHPHGGWLKSTRLARGLSLRAVGELMSVSPQELHQFEKSEVMGTISLRQLETIARTMDCRVIYALMPLETPPAVASQEAPIAARVPKAIEHTMFLDNQASDRFA